TSEPDAAGNSKKRSGSSGHGTHGRTRTHENGMTGTSGSGCFRNVYYWPTTRRFLPVHRFPGTHLMKRHVFALATALFAGPSIAGIPAQDHGQARARDEHGLTRTNTDPGTRPPSGRFELTVDSIMRGPDLVGYPPTGLRWSADSQKLFFEWRKPGETEPSTYVADRDGGNLRKLSDEETKSAPAANGRW